MSPTSYHEPLARDGAPAHRRVRVIPTLLIDSRGRLVKTVKFGKRTYIGDPINAVKIFNTKEVDELILLDIDASKDGREPNYALIEDIVGEAFMPVAYGGGIASIEHVSNLYKRGIEKVVLSSNASQQLISGIAQRFGSQAVVICLQVKKPLFGAAKVFTHSASRNLGEAPASTAKAAVEAGAGEIVVYSVDRDGTFSGYDIELLKSVASTVEVPVVACGGARNIDDMLSAIRDGHCSAVAAGSMFVYQSERRGVLISYPSQAALDANLFGRLT